MDLSKQQAFHANKKEMQEINFTRYLNKRDVQQCF